MAGWLHLRGQTEIAFVTLFLWIVASSFLYLAASVLVPGAPTWEASDPRTKLHPLRAAFYFFLATHFGVVFLERVVAEDARILEGSGLFVAGMDADRCVGLGCRCRHGIRARWAEKWPSEQISTLRKR
jgi:hypothetical protein